MTKHPLFDVIEEQLEAVLDLEDKQIEKLSIILAFYQAMLDAAAEDPLDDPEDQTIIMQHLEEQSKKTLTQFMDRVNELM